MSDERDHGAFVETTNVYDILNITEENLKGENLAKILVKIRQSINNIALVLNIKDSGYYVDVEFLNGQLFLPDPALTDTTPQTPTYRQAYRLLVDFGALPNTAAKNVAHGLTITADFTFTRIYACASDPAGFTYIPIPNNTNADISVGAANVTITTTANLTNYTRCYAILEYIKN